MLNPESAVVAQLDAFNDMVRTRDQALLDALWGDGGFVMVGSEAGEICRTRLELAAVGGGMKTSSASCIRIGLRKNRFIQSH